MHRMPLSERREQLVDAAVTVIANRGLSAATTRAIVAEASMPLASFHHVFESHHMCLVKAMGVLVDRQAADLRFPEPGDETLAEYLFRALGVWVDHLVAFPLQHLAVRELTAYFLRTPHETAHASLWRRRHIELIIGLISDFDRAQAQSVHRDAEFVASTIVSLCDALESGYLLDRDEAFARRYLAALLPPNGLFAPYIIGDGDFEKSRS